MTKPQHKKPARRSSLLKTILISTGLLLLIAPVAYVSYQKYLTHQEAQSFAALKQDMLTLQTEFDKVDPGWEYREGCRRGQAVFDSSADSCFIILSKNTFAINAKNEEILLSKISRLNGFVEQSRQEYEFENEDKILINYSYQSSSKIICQLSGPRNVTAKSTDTSSGLNCRGEARDYYFERFD